MPPSDELYAIRAPSGDHDGAPPFRVFASACTATPFGLTRKSRRGPLAGTRVNTIRSRVGEKAGSRSLAGPLVILVRPVPSGVTVNRSRLPAPDFPDSARLSRAA